MTDRKPTDAELEILSVLWKSGPCTVKQVHQALPDHHLRGYTTVLKLLQIMSTKGLVKRDEHQRAHIYEAAVTAEQTQRNMLAHLVDRAFAGSTNRLIMQALKSQGTTEEELKEIRQLLDKMEHEHNDGATHNHD
ncbi:MAG: BlaI/MecI/CopY family transcriptional regulator [Candidatus Zixiibacteriota bacterium]|nr:MAG: BlaI/MecI/CopY family transcriptional regulator [candidate division Zixibacteria bacterium]